MKYAMHSFSEETLEERCSFCKKEHNAQLERTFYLNFEYLTGDCASCGHTISIKQ